MLASSQWWVGLLLFILSTGEVSGEDIPWRASGQCQPVYQLECAGCSLRLEKLCEISLEERPVEARLLQCRNITNPACQGGLTTRCSVRQGIISFHQPRHKSDSSEGVVRVQTSSENLFVGDF